MTYMLRRLFRPTQALAALAVAGCLLVPRAASAEVTLVEKDGWKVFISGRVQAFLNYNKGDGHPEPGVVDGNGASVTLRGGGQVPADAYHEYPAAQTDATGAPIPPSAADRV